MRGVSNQSGFTLLEIMLVVALVSVIAGFSTPLILRAQRQNDLDIASTSVVQSLRRAQILAQTAKADGDWGVYITNDQVVVFTGSSFAGRDVGYDEEIDLGNAISASGDQEFIFEKLTGFTSTGSATLSTDTDSQEISINEKGMLTY